MSGLASAVATGVAAAFLSSLSPPGAPPQPATSADRASAASTLFAFTGPPSSLPAVALATSAHVLRPPPRAPSTSPPPQPRWRPSLRGMHTGPPSADAARALFPSGRPTRRRRRTSRRRLSCRLLRRPRLRRGPPPPHRRQVRLPGPTSRSPAVPPARAAPPPSPH